MDEDNVQTQTAASDSNSEESSKQESAALPLDQRICLVGDVINDSAACRAAQSFGIPVLTSKTGSEYINDVPCTTTFVLDAFEGPVFEKLHKAEVSLLGPTALKQLAANNDPLPNNVRPWYTLSMRGVIICFTGFRKKEDLKTMIPLIHHMGGSIRKDMAINITHLISNVCMGEKYRYACTFKVPILSQDWVYDAWLKRTDDSFRATQEAFVTEHKLKPFFGARISFLGFSSEETQHMQEVLEANGGVVTVPDDPLCSHVVMDNEETFDIVKAQVPSPSFNPGSPIAPETPSGDQTDVSLTSSNVDYTMETDKSANKRGFLDTIDETPERDVFKDDITSPLKRKRDENDFGTVDSVPDMTTPVASVNKKRRLSMTPRFMEVLKTPMSLFTPKRRQSIATKTLQIADDGFMSSTGLLFVTPPSEEASNIDSISAQSMSIDDDTKFNNISKQKGPFYKSLTRKRSKYLTSTNIKTQSSENCGSKEKEELSNEFLDDLNNRMTLSPELHISKKIKSLKTESRLESLDDTIILSPDSIESKTKTPQTEPRFMNSKSSDKKILEIRPRRYSVCVMSDQDPVFSKSSESYPSGPQPDATASSHRRLHFGRSVVDDGSVTERPEINTRALIVKAEWFWVSVQNAACMEEKDYSFEDFLESLNTPGRRDSHLPITPSSMTASGRRKRKRFTALSSLVRGASVSGTPAAATDSPSSVCHGKRRSSISDAGLLSVSGSFLDSTVSPDKSLLLDEPECVAAETASGRKNLSPRQQVFLELVQTESNYVNILHTIMTMFKSHLEDMPEPEALLNNTEQKIIFGNLPPIYETHSKMLEELRWSSAHWSEDTSIGNIFLKYSNDLMKAYPPFVNFFETMKDMLVQCDNTKPRFHAFLKVCQTRPECGRQSLQELLIRPVQRLPSISLLLNDILKHTTKSNPDHAALEKAISSIKEVMTHINEDKRKTEGQLAMFDIFNEIDNCPALLISSQRSYVSRCEVQELSDGLSGRGDMLVLFLFNDILEVCKKRSKAFNNFKSPNVVNGHLPHHGLKANAVKPYKHVKLMPLSTIKKVIDIRESDDCHKVFALMCRNNQELKEKLYSFTITDEECEKTSFLKTLSRHMANTVCQADADRFLTCLDSDQLEIDTSDVTLGTLSKAFKFASRTRMKVGRAFSFNKTPSKLKRAMSTMMSPFGSTTNLTPASQLAQMRLASCNNINELGGSGTTMPGSPTSSDVLVAPMSVQPTRKAKCSSLSMAALRRL